jgi:hypothetical protein
MRATVTRWLALPAWGEAPKVTDAAFADSDRFTAHAERMTRYPGGCTKGSSG